MSGRTRIFRKGFQFFVGAFLSLLVVELFYRIVEQTPAWSVLPVIQREPGWPDKQFGYRLRPNVDFIQVEENRSRVVINSVGLRDQEVQVEKPEGITRIGLLGDSIIEGVHVPWAQTVDARLEEELKDNFRIEVLNFSQSGASLPQLLEIAKAFQAKFEIDLFVVNHSAMEFLSGNMFDNGRLPGYRRNQSRQWEMGYKFRNRFSVRQRDELMGKVFYLIMDHSRVAYGAYQVYKQGMFFRNSGWGKGISKKPRCDENNILSAIEVWSEQGRSDLSQIQKQFLSDVSAFKRSTSTEVAFAWTGLTNRNSKCRELDQYFDELRPVVSKAMKRFGFPYLDVSASEEHEVTVDKKREVWQLTGFGATLGKGHLNKYGHDVRARLLNKFITPILAPARAGGSQ
jgi:hypothetical protein